MLITVLRTVIMYIFVVFTIRVMGKRQIGELEPSELVVTIIISEIAAMPITNIGQPMIGPIVAILLLMVMEIGISFAAYKNVGLRSVLYGKASTFYKKGKINQQEMERQRFNVGDLLEVVRNTGASSLDEVDYVIMETNGNISVILNAQNRPLTPSDMKLKPQSPEVSYLVIDNGIVIKSNLKRLGYDDIWLKRTLDKNHIENPKQVFYLGVSESGKVMIIPKEKKK